MILDKRFILGLGAGICISSLILYSCGYGRKLDDATIEMEARKKGMIYENELRVNLEKGAEKNE